MKIPMLHDMARIGSLSCTESIVGGGVRTYDAVTDEGQRALSEAKETMGELAVEVGEGEGPASLPNVEAAHSEGNHHEL